MNSRVNNLPLWTNGYWARNITQSARPDLWPDYAWVPSMGPTGTKLFDVGGRGNHGDIVGASWEADGALSFSGGTGERVTFDQITLSGPSAIVIDLTTPASYGSWDMYIGKYDSDNFIGLGFSGAYLRIQDSINANSDWNTVSLNTNTRYCVAHVYDGNDWILYIDGICYGAGNVSSNASTLLIDNIGRPYTTTSYNWNGKMRSVYIYHKALTHSQISNLSHNLTLPFQRRPIIDYVPSGVGPSPSFKPYYMNNNRIIA